jgi:hypothetical protein
MSPSKFQKLIDDEKTTLNDLCDLWENHLTISEQTEKEEGPPSSRTRSASAAETSSESIKIEDEELLGLMRATTGQGRMLIEQRFVQFEKLIKDAEEKTSEKTIGDDDLQGFWDMIDFQVVDMKEKFDVLEKAKANSWKLEHETKEIKPTPNPKAKPVAKPASATKEKKAKPAQKSNIRDFIAQKRREAQAQKKKEEETAGGAAA